MAGLRWPTSPSRAVPARYPGNRARPPGEPRARPRRSRRAKTRSESAGSPRYRLPVPDSDILIRAEHLTKRFGDFTAVDGIGFELRRGEAFGFLGPNGAGKSSTMRMIGCVSPPSGRSEERRVGKECR